MNNDINNDKIKLEEMINEIVKLKSYSKELANNTRGNKLEDYIDVLSRNILSLQNKVETIYDENYRNIE